MGLSHNLLCWVFVRTHCVSSHCVSCIELCGETVNKGCVVVMRLAAVELAWLLWCMQYNCYVRSCVVLCSRDVPRLVNKRLRSRSRSNSRHRWVELLSTGSHLVQICHRVSWIFVFQFVMAWNVIEKKWGPWNECVQISSWKSLNVSFFLYVNY